MQQLLALVVLLLAWVEVATIAIPKILTNNQWAYRHPRTAITIWFAALLSAGLSVFGALCIAFAAAFEIWWSPNEFSSKTTLAEQLLISFAPWLLLAMTGIALALASRAIEPQLAQVQPISKLEVGRPVAKYRSVTLREVEIDFPILLSLGTTLLQKNSAIVYSTAIRKALNQTQFDAALSHEYAHLLQLHSIGKVATKIAALLSYRILETKLIQIETNLLFEIAADNYAAKRTSKAAIASAISVLWPAGADSQSQLRIALLNK